MSATFPGFVILFGLLHVCSGKTRTLPALVDIKTQQKKNPALFIWSKNAKCGSDSGFS